MITRAYAGAITLLLLSANLAHAADDCEKQAADKNLSGMAKMTFLAKCKGKGAGEGAAKECAKQAKEKGLSNAAKATFIQKCAKEGATK
jgi:hypothetical protein